MEYYLGLIRYDYEIKRNGGTFTINKAEMTQLIKASNKELAREALLEYWEKESNGATLIEARINDTVIGK